MRKSYLLSLIIPLFFATPASAGKITIGGTAPTVEIDETLYPNLTKEINLRISDSWNQLLVDADKELGKYGYTPNLAEGFSNANAYAASAGTIQGYQNYSLFSVSTGVMIGVQAPTLSLSYYDPEKLKDRIKEEGDVYAGASAGICFLNVGILADFLASDLYFNIKFGTLKLKVTSESNEGTVSEVGIKSTMIGIGVNYALVKAHNVGGGETWWRRELIGGLARWRGLSVGAGFIYSSNRVDFTINKVSSKEISEDFSATGNGHTLTGSLMVNPSASIGVEMKTYTIPLEIVTSVQLLWLLNFTLGAGVDFNFGDTDIALNSDSPVKVDKLSLDGKSISQNAIPGLKKINDGTLVVTGSTKDKTPSTLRPKVMTGIGVNLFPVKIDIPIIYYPKTGAAVGVTVAVVW